MRMIRMLALLAFLAAWLVTGGGTDTIAATEAMAAPARATGAATDECWDAYPEECFNDEPASFCNDGNCEDPEPPWYLPPGFTAWCVPVHDSCEEVYPDWCLDMYALCNNICWKNGENGEGTGIDDWYCEQDWDCYAECSCGLCIES